MLDPTPFAAFGVLGGLLFALVIMTLLLRNILEKQSERYHKSEEALMEFVNGHRKETTASLHDIAIKIADSHDRLGYVIDRHTRRLDEFLLTSEVMRRIDTAKRRGETPLDDTLIEKIVRTVISEKKRD